jgi:hypothetical protein
MHVTKALSTSRAPKTAPRADLGAGDGIRTRDPKLGKLVLYQLSYSRDLALHDTQPPRTRKLNLAVTPSSRKLA